MKSFHIIIVLCLIGLTACKKKESQLPDQGNVNVVESVKVYAGRDRVELNWQLPSNNALKECIISWNDGKGSLTVPVTPGSDAMSKVIDGLSEGAYTFEIRSYDNNNHASPAVTVKGNVYGDQYEDSLQNRAIRSVNAPFSGNHELVIAWNDAVAGTLGSEIKYEDAGGALHTEFTAQFISSTTLKDYKSGRLLEYRTLYLPELNAIDTFYTAFEPIEVSGLPDFSFAGYERNEQVIPLVPVMRTVSPGPGDDGQRIQQAIDEVAQLPLTGNFRGAVLLTAGDYEVEDAIIIPASGIVLRGEGQGDDGTVIMATATKQYNFIQVKGSGSDNESAQTPVTAEKVPVGAVKIPVENASAFHVGDTVVVKKTPNDNWINTLDMAQYGWAAKDYRIAHRRIIRKITADTLYVGIPLVDAVEEKYGGGYVALVNSPGRISHCGVENLRVVSQYKSDDDEAHGWVGVSLNRAFNCWVRNVTAAYFGYACVGLYQADFNTIQDCAMLDPKSITTGSRKYSFYIDKGLGNLFQRCYTRGGRHDFVTGSRVTGPNVFFDCYATNTQADLGPHHRWATGTLFDNIYGGQIHVQNRKAMGSGHGWAGVQQMFWNCYATKGFIIEAPPIGQNWGVGCNGSSKSGNGYWESWGTPVQPRSLFLSQLKERLGESAVNAITIPSQRSGDIWDALKQWAGSGSPLQTLH